jgi:hypothetical protein
MALLQGSCARERRAAAMSDRHARSCTPREVHLLEYLRGLINSYAHFHLGHCVAHARAMDAPQSEPGALSV